MTDIEHPLIFTGNFKSYFKLCCENGLLLLISVGLLLPWTLLRKKRYFYQHTQLAGSHFSFTAKPKSMFIGVFSAMILWFSLQHFFELMAEDDSMVKSVIMAFVFFNILLVPIFAFFVNQALLFRRFHSNFRGIRFGFKKDYAEAFICCAGVFIFSPLTLFAAYPYFKWRFAKFIYNRSDFGGLRFRFTGDLKTLYAIYLKCYGLIIVSAILILPVFLMYFWIIWFGDSDPDKTQPFWMTQFETYFLPHFSGAPSAISSFAGIVLLFFITLPYLKVQTTNWTWNALKIGDLRAYSFASTRRLIGLSSVNFFMVIFSLGLLAPLAKIRTQQFWTENKSFAGDLNGLLIKAQQHQDTHAMGDALSDLSGIDMGV